MEKSRRKELVREYKEKKQQLGVYAVRCDVSGEAWVASSRNLDRQKNGLWFALRADSHPNKALLAAWKKHGEAAFQYEVLEEVTDDNLLLLDLLMKDRAAHWLKTLGAQPVIS